MKLIGERPPLSDESRKQIEEITDKLNEDAIIQFTPHNVLEMAIDRAWKAMFPEQVSEVKRKKYQRIDF